MVQVSSGEWIMKSRIAVSLALGLVALTETTVQAQPGRRGDMQGARFGWLPSLEEGKARARNNGKPLLVVVRCVP
jgi:hypothetical protein